MKLFVKAPSGKLWSLDVEPSDSIGFLQEKAFLSEGLEGEPDSYYLTQGGRGLLLNRTVADYGLRQGNTLDIQFRLTGAANLGKKIKGSAEQRAAGAPFAELEARYAKMREADTLRQRALLKQQELKSRMEQEQKNSKTNQLKIQNQWRKIMRLAKVESLKKDIEILSQNHERDVDRKDAIIQMLDRDLEEAEDQFQTALRAHLRNLDRLIDLQDSRLLALEQEFEGELRELEADFNAERDQIREQHAREVQELRDVMAEVDQLEAEQEAEFRTEHEQNREENKNKNIEDINMLRLTLDQHIEDLELSFEQAHLQYLQNTDQRTQEFKYLREQDAQQSRQIEQKIRRIEGLQARLAHWRAKVAQNVRENAERNRLLLEERNAIQAHFQALKGRMNRFRADQGKRLARLTKDAHACKDKLDEKIAMAERILKLAELARKQETEQEKVIPFFLSAQGDQLDREAQVMADKQAQANVEGEADVKIAWEEPVTPLQASAWDRVPGVGGEGGEGGGGAAPGLQKVPHWNMLDNFHKKYNRALLDKLAIERERERLVKENADLQDILKQYLDGVSVNDDVMNASNPLFVVNGRTNLNRQLPVRRREDGIPVVEANHMVGTQRVGTRMPL